MSLFAITPFEKMKIFGMMDCAVAIKTNTMPNPKMAVFYPTYKCNNNCVGCLYKEINAKEHSMMSISNIKHTLKQLQELYVQSVELTGGGEPTLHPDFPEILRLIREHNMAVGVLTNGTRLHGVPANAVLDFATYIRISMDAHTEHLHNQIHRPKKPDGFHRIETNIKELILKRKCRDSKTSIGAKVLICKINSALLDEIVKYTKTIGFDYLQFKLMRNSEYSIDNLEKRIQINDTIEQLRLKNPLFPIYGSSLQSIATRPCWMTPIHVVIDANGDVFPCCYFQHRKNAMLMGNVFNDSLKTIWFRRQHHEVLKNIKIEECNLYDCRWHYYNEIMHQAVIENKLHYEFI